METYGNGQMVRALFGCLSFLLALSSCSGPKHEETQDAALQSWSETVQLDATHTGISIANTSDRSVSFHLKLNGRFPLNVDEMVEEIRAKVALDSTPPAVAAWQFVSDNTYHLDPYSVSPWMHDPYILVNSLGGGFCDDRSSVLHLLWNKMGFEARVMELNGHVVAEVKDNGLWKHFDPDHEVYYVDEDGSTVGVAYLEKNGCNGVETVGANAVQKKLWDCRTYDADLQMNLYKSDEDNKDATDWNMNFIPLQNEKHTLPPGSELIFIRGEKNRPAVAVVKLTQASKGLLRIPLVPYAIKGNGAFEIGGRTYNLSQEKLLSPSKDKLQDSINITTVNEEAWVYYHINPKVCGLTDENSIQVSNCTGKLEISQTQETAVVYSTQRSDAINFDRSKENHLAYLSRMPRGFNPSTFENIRAEYNAFLQLDKKLDPIARKRLFAKFYTDINMVQDTLQLNEEQLLQLVEKRYPQSMLWMFLTMRYGGYRYLHRLRFTDAEHHLSSVQ